MDSLVSVEWLSEHFEDKNIIVLDATMPTVTNKGVMSDDNLSISGALYFDLRNIFKDRNSKYPNTMPTVQVFEEGVSQLGIRKESSVIIYDNYGVHTSPRAWYLFKLMGHSNVAVLNGGLPAWEKAGLLIDEKEMIKCNKSIYQAQKKEEALRTFDFVDKHKENTEYLILDARSSDRFNGTAPEPRKNLQSGCIPNSLNIPYTRVLRDGYMKTKEELKDVFGEQVLKVERHIIASCGSGLTACILLLALDQIGIRNASLFDGSWTEWATKKELFTRVF